MNKKQRIFLRVLGVIIFFITFLTLNLFISPELNSNIRKSYLLCNLEINNLNVGQVLQIITENQKNCNNVELLMKIINYGWIGYLLGIFLFVIGVWAGLGNNKISKLN